MISLLLALWTAVATPCAAPPQDDSDTSPALAPQDLERKAEYERRKKAAGEDVQALWDLYLWCDAYAMSSEARACLRAIIRTEPNHRQARELLGHILYDGKWFTTEKLLEKYKKEEEERLAKEKGLVRYEDRWVPAEDVPFLERGMVRDDDGRWTSAEDLEKLAAGWRRQDLEWIPPGETSNIEKGLWKCGERWLSETEANQYHSELDRWWIIPGEHFLLFTTCDRAVAKRAHEALELAYRDLVRTFGIAPDALLPVVVLREIEQYGRFAAGEEGSRPPTELRALSSIHYAYFADGWFDAGTKSFVGAGVALWDASTEAGDLRGPLAARHAAAQAFVEAIDPSPKTVAKGEKAGGLTEADAGEFWSEKKLPEWLRVGAAGYVERYFVDHLVKPGGNPYWTREWSVQNLVSRGGPRPLSQIFEAQLTIDDREGSEMLINERGLVMAFVLDGACEPVVDAHSDLLMALREGKPPARAIEQLQKAIKKHEAELRSFARL